MAIISKPYNAFFDESGTHDGSEVVAVGGLLATYEAWVRVELEWRQVLSSKEGVAVFHFTDFMARRPPFNWPNQERDDFMERLTTIIGENVSLGIAYGIYREDYEALPSGLRNDFKDIYHCCSYFCLESLVKWRKTFTGPELPKPLEFLFDRKKGFEGLAASIYYEVIKDIDAEGLFGDMAFGSKEKDVPLQMADLLVGVAIRKFKRERIQGLDASPDRAEQSMNRNGRLLLLGLQKQDLHGVIKAIVRRALNEK
ncbi:MAG: DUF3800 domain-containing protein [Candidatus Binataceae bacterium]